MVSPIKHRMFILHGSCLLFFMLIVLSGGTNGALAQRIWPQILEISANYQVDFSQESFRISKSIVDTNGTVRYSLICGGGRAAVTAGLVPATHQYYIGPLTCKLFPGDGESWGNLLTPDPYDVSDSDMLGHFEQSDLIPPCNSIAGLGRKREFRLRGMHLTLALDPVGPEPDIASDPLGRPWVLHISAEPDPLARTARAIPEVPVSAFRSEDAGRDQEKSCHNVIRYLDWSYIVSIMKCFNPEIYMRFWECNKNSELYEPYIWESNPYVGQERQSAKNISMLHELVISFPLPKDIPLSKDRFDDYHSWFVSWKERVEKGAYKAVASGDMKYVKDFVPPFPFLFQCGAVGTDAWGAISVNNDEEFDHLWRVVSEIIMRELYNWRSPILRFVDISSIYSFWFWDGLLRLQPGLTVGTVVSCSKIKEALARMPED